MAERRAGLSRRELLRDTAAIGAAAVVAGPLAASARARRTGPPRVAILGGGMGGLATAHELAERGFAVTVFERKALGGKARSMPVPDSRTPGRRPLPGEHGFRFFPGFYHHVPDSMARTPYPGNENGCKDNLVDASTTSFARAGREDFVLYNDVPPYVPPEERNVDQLIRVIAGLFQTGGSIPPQETVFFAKQILMFMSSCEERRYGQWEYVSWWDYTRAERMSEEGRKMLATGLTRNLVAAKAELASSRTIGRMAEAFFTNVLYKDGFQGEGEPDRVLNGPTNEAWIRPWIRHLKGFGVDFEVGWNVTALELGGGAITSARATHAGRERVIEADYFVVAMPIERALRLWSPAILAAHPILGRGGELVTDWMNGIMYYLDRRLPTIRGHYSFVDSPWALTGLTQQQFWADRDIATRYGDGRVRDILSVDISDWVTPGILYGKPAKRCTPGEIAREVWAQMKAHLNDTGKTVLRDEAIVRWFLDPAIKPMRKGRRARNTERLLINTVGSWDIRPEAVTPISNLFLAADYVRTDMDLATMEAANEAGRLAANGILEQAGRPADVRLYHLFDHPEMAIPRNLDRERYKLGLPHVLDTP